MGEGGGGIFVLGGMMSWMFSSHLRFGFVDSLFYSILFHVFPILCHKGFRLALNIENTRDLGCRRVSQRLCECFSESNLSQKWFLLNILLSHEHCRDDQKSIFLV